MCTCSTSACALAMKRIMSGEDTMGRRVETLSDQRIEHTGQVSPARLSSARDVPCGETEWRNIHGRWGLRASGTWTRGLVILRVCVFSRDSCLHVVAHRVTVRHGAGAHANARIVVANRCS